MADSRLRQIKIKTGVVRRLGNRDGKPMLGNEQLCADPGQSWCGPACSHDWQKKKLCTKKKQNSKKKRLKK